VGKTSLIQALLLETFSEQVPAVLPEICIPEEISPEGVNTILVDTGSHSEAARVAQEEAIRQADVVCVVYGVDELSTFHRLGTHWLPLVRSLHPSGSIPVILVGNRIDTRGIDVTNDELEDEILPLMSEFKEIETCVECSARTLINVAEAFYFAQKAVLHPTGPLYDARTHELREEAARALERIFRLSDIDADGVLSDEELNGFQMKCFRTPLQREELESIKEILLEAEPEGVTSLEDGSSGVTLMGFLALHRLFIQRGRLETTWSALRAFGYTDTLLLPESMLTPVQKDTNVIMGLSPAAYTFLTGLFHSHDKEERGTLCAEQLESLLLPISLELGDASAASTWIGMHETAVGSRRDDTGARLTLDGFLGQWALLAMLDYPLAYLIFVLLGCQDDTVNMFKAVPKAHRGQRDTFLCWILGAPGSGKTSLTRRLLHQQVTGYRPTQESRLSVASLALPDGTGERFLALEEIPSHNACDLEAILDPSRLSRADAICYVYDQSDADRSLSYIQDLLAKHPELSAVPSILLANKMDMSASGTIDIDAFASSHGMTLIQVSASQDNDEILTDSLWTPILSLASSPRSGKASPASRWIAPLAVGLGLLAGGAAAWILYNRATQRKDSD